MLHTDKVVRVLAQAKGGYPVGTLRGSPLSQQAHGTGMRGVGVGESGRSVVRASHVGLCARLKVVGRQSGRGKVIVGVRVLMIGGRVCHEGGVVVVVLVVVLVVNVADGVGFVLGAWGRGWGWGWAGMGPVGVEKVSSLEVGPIDDACAMRHSGQP